MLHQQSKINLAKTWDLRKFVEDDVYVGKLHYGVMQSFQVDCNLFEGYFVAICLVDNNTRFVWIARLLFDPTSNPD